MTQTALVALVHLTFPAAESLRFIWKKDDEMLTSLSYITLSTAVVLPGRESSLIYCSLIKIWDAMNVNIQTVHFDADGKLVEYVTKKMSKLNTFNDRIITVDVFLKLDNVVHNIKDKIAEIRVHVPRHHFFVKCSSKSFEESFDSAFDSLVNQVKRKKDKQVA